MALGTTWPQHNQQVLKLITPKIENCIITKALGCEKLQETEAHTYLGKLIEELQKIKIQNCQRLKSKTAIVNIKEIRN